MYSSRSTLNAQAPTPPPEKKSISGSWLRISKLARAVVVELGNNSEIGNYHVYKAQPQHVHGWNSGESQTDKRDHGQTASIIADPYGLIGRWRTRTDGNSPELLASNP